MKITSVSTAVVQANFDYVFVRVQTDEGVGGTGESFFAPGITAIIRELGEVVIGHDPQQIRPLWKRLQAAAGGTSGTGIVYNAISGIETALWDINGRLLGVPVSTLLGGRYRDYVEVYADLHAGAELPSLDRVLRYRTPFWMSPDGATRTRGSFWEEGDEGGASYESTLARAKDAIRAGFRRIKFDLDVFGRERETGERTITPRELASLAETAVGLRETLGPDVGLAFDCHWRFDVPTALAVAEAVAGTDPMWLEDPVPPDPNALRAVAARSPVPIATGENVYLLDGFLPLIEGGCVHVVTPDAQKTGGLLEASRIADLADRYFLPVAAHCIASPLGLVATAHVMAASPNATCLEFHGTDVPFWSELVVGEAPLIDRGRCRVPDAPGLGVELNLDVVRAYAAPGEWVFDEEPAR